MQLNEILYLLNTNNLSLSVEMLFVIYFRTRKIRALFTHDIHAGL